MDTVVARPMRSSGRTVVGVDPAAASLDVARSKDENGAVTWIHGDAAITERTIRR